MAIADMFIEDLTTLKYDILIDFGSGALNS